MSAILRTEGISIAFGGVKAVQQVSFDVNRGEILGLIGPNGSGKSTVVNLISGMYKLNEGTVFFDGKEVPRNMGVAARAKLGMGRTFQTPQPFGALSVYDNVYIIALQKRSARDAETRAEEVLRETKLIEHRDMQSSKLPIEKRKWLDLARILVNDPKLIMLDEVMAGLNPSEMDESLDLILHLNKALGISFLFIEHVMKAVVKICSRCIVLNEGKLLAEGAPTEALAREDVIAAYIGEVEE